MHMHTMRWVLVVALTTCCLGSSSRPCVDHAVSSLLSQRMMMDDGWVGGPKEEEGSCSGGPTHSRGGR